MDKTAIKNFSIWARNKLIADITYKAGLLGVTEEGIKEALPQSTQEAEFFDIGTKEPYAIHGEEIKQRKELVAAIKRKAEQLAFKDAYRNVIEEVAYTWFNRLIAIRFMEVNDYMPSHIRVLSSESGTKLEPALVTTPFDAEIEFTQAETEKIMQLKQDNQVDALFRMLFVKQCNALNAYLPKLFEKTSDYTELLLNVSVTDQDGIVYHLTHDIKEDDFNISNMGEDGKPTGQVEIIGWMYQYYNTEPKDEAFALLKKNVKITKERIPAATQLFTPDWIVRYMVENSVGRLWLEGHENDSLKSEWKYYLDEAEQEADVEEQLKAIREEYKNITPEEIKVIDPCMGSGHILVYAFDVLMQIYESYGYSQRDAAKSIVENNIYGLDIDDRAFQLAYFAIMMKARSYNRRFLTLGIEPNLCAIQESNGLQYDRDMGDFLLSEEHRETLKYLLTTFKDAKEYGSILEVEKRDYDGFLKAWELTADATTENVVMLLWYNECNQIVPMLAKQAKVFSQKYEVVVTNPPYMSISSGTGRLNEYVKKIYSISKNDLYSVFIERCNYWVALGGYQAMITQQAWMFSAIYCQLRHFLNNSNIVNLVQLGARAFDEINGEVVQTASFVLRKSNICNYVGRYTDLTDGKSEHEKEQKFLLQGCDYVAAYEDFQKIPNGSMAYWLSEEAINDFGRNKLSDVFTTREGMTTADNEQFLRCWYEVDFQHIGLDMENEDESVRSGKKWFPYNKGGNNRKWYGNNELVVNWENAGSAIRNLSDIKTGRIRSHNYNGEYSFREAGTWTAICSGDIMVRYSPKGALFDSKGASGFSADNDSLLYCIGLLNSKVSSVFLKVLSPAFEYKVGHVSNVPYIEGKRDEVVEHTQQAINISKLAWDENEISKDYLIDPIVSIAKTKGICRIEEAVVLFKNRRQSLRQSLLEHEISINEIFINLYNLQEELDKENNIDELSIEWLEDEKIVKNIISYAIGCLFGRYSSDATGALCTSNDMNKTLYQTFNPDDDNIIPVLDDEYVTNDLVGLFCQWIKSVFGSAEYDENMLYLGNTLSSKGDTAKEKLRNYFLNDFYKEHCNMYGSSGLGKRPIYWLFDSGKQNGFKALVYMHRYNADTIGNLRIDYLHRMERIYESEINRMQDTIDNSSNAREVTAASKRKEKLHKQLKECKEYDEKIGHLALSRIEIDLDDGVKVNYEKVQTANDGKKYQVLAKI